MTSRVQVLAGAIGFDFSEYSNEMASIHSILKRMRDAKDVEFDGATDTYYLRTRMD
jgi:hypothetical protein